MSEKPTNGAPGDGAVDDAAGDVSVAAVDGAVGGESVNIESVDDAVREVAAASSDADAGDDHEIPVEVEADDADTDAVDTTAGAVDGELIEVVGTDTAAEALAAAEARVAELAREKDELYQRLLRSAADLENFRKRSRREVDEARVDARSKTLREMLPVADNLERAVMHAEASTGDVASVIDGVKLVLRQFEQALEKCDVRPVDARLKPFDPNFHEAIAQKESAEVDPGTVVEVLQRGYTIGQRLLRPALVVVSRAAPAQPEVAPNGDTGDDGDAAGDTPDASDTNQEA